MTNPETMPLAQLIQRPAWRDTFSALRFHNYRLYVTAQLIGNTAGWMQRIAVDWLVLELTGSVALVGLTIALQFLPTLVLGAYAGVVADRFPKRAMLLLCQSVAGILSFVLAAIAILGIAQLWAVYALVLAIGVAQVFDGPARSVFVNELVGPHHLRNAISVNASIFHLGALVGPALSGILIVLVGSGWAIGVNAVAMMIGVALLLAIRSRDLLVAPRVPVRKGQVREAARYIMGKPPLFWTLVMVTFVAVFGMPMPALLAGIADSVYKTGATGYGFYNSLAAVGALVAALASARRSTLRVRSLVVGLLLYGLSLVLAGLAPFYPMFLVVLVSVGLTRVLFMTAGETMMQFSSNLGVRGRVMAFWTMVIVGGQAIGGPLMGWIAEQLGPKNAMVVSGAVPAIAAVVIAILLGRDRLRSRWSRRRVRSEPGTLRLRRRPSSASSAPQSDS